jgi:ABC-type multidrug transport system fused ATPase/permease subunit
VTAGIHTVVPAIPGGKAGARVGAMESRQTRRAGRFETIYRLAGGKVCAFLAASIPIGLVLGGAEIATAFAFYFVLAKFNLVGVASPAWLPNHVDPVILLILASLLAAALRFLSQLLPNMAQLAFAAYIRHAVADAALNHRGEGPGLSVAEASHLVGTMARQAATFHLGATQSIGIGSVLILVIGQMLYMSWQLTAISLVGAAVLGLPLLYLRPVSGVFSDKQYSVHQLFTYRLLKDVRNAHFLKICGLNRLEVDQLDDLLHVGYGYSRSYQLLSAFAANLPSFGGVLLVLGLLWLNDIFAIIPVVTLVPYVYLLNRAIGGLALLSSSAGVLRENLRSVTELYNYADILFPVPAQSETHGGLAVPRLVALDIRELEFGRSAPLTPPLSLAVRAGEMLLINGASGRGKTTLLLTLIGLVRPLSGAVAWSEVPLDAIDPVELRRKIGYAGPEPYLIDADIRANLLFGLGRTQVEPADISLALDLACAEFVYELDGGLAYQLRENGDGISAGQKQRLALARCLLRRPEVLLLDEATANIDEQTERAFFERLRSGRPDLLIIAVSHRSSLRGFADRILNLDGGP